MLKKLQFFYYIGLKLNQMYDNILLCISEISIYKED